MKLGHEAARSPLSSSVPHTCRLSCSAGCAVRGDTGGSQAAATRALRTLATDPADARAVLSLIRALSGQHDGSGAQGPLEALCPNNGLSEVPSVFEAARGRCCYGFAGSRANAAACSVGWIGRRLGSLEHRDRKRGDARDNFAWAAYGANARGSGSPMPSAMARSAGTGKMPRARRSRGGTTTWKTPASELPDHEAWAMRCRGTRSGTWADLLFAGSVTRIVTAWSKEEPCSHRRLPFP